MPESLREAIHATGVEYGVKYSTDTCFVCWCAGKDVPAVAEAFTPDETERTSICLGHYFQLVGELKRA